MNGDSIPDLDCLTNEVKCFQGCVASFAANQKAELKNCLENSDKARSTADQAARTAFRTEKVSIDLALKNAQAYGTRLGLYFPAYTKVRDDKMIANKTAHDTAAKGCWDKFGKK